MRLRNSILTALFSLLSLNLTLANVRWQEVETSDEKQRLVMLSDMGNETDEQQQIMHLLLYADQFDLEALIAVTGKYLNPKSGSAYKRVLHPELFHSIIKGYSQAYKSLAKHSDLKFPTPDYLHSIVYSGQTGYGSDAIGEGFSSEGSRRLEELFAKDDPRPLFIVVNAGSNTLAQALDDYARSHTPEQMARVISKLRIYENGAQDDAGAYIMNRYPDIHWVRSNYQVYCYAGPSWDGGFNNSGDRNELGPYTWEPYEYSGIGQHQWSLKHICGDHGAYGACWPLRQLGKGRLVYLEGGGTVPWLSLINKGLSDINHLYWGGWSGRCGRERGDNYWSKHESVRHGEERYTPFKMYVEESDKWTNPEDGTLYDNVYAPVWRWRRAFFNDFMYRMDWCVGEFEECNHRPRAVIDGVDGETILTTQANAGDVLNIDASLSSDPDGDSVHYFWSYYPEAGSYKGDVKVTKRDRSRVKIKIPKDAAGSEIHLILELRDNSSRKDAMYSYRRMVISVE